MRGRALSSRYIFSSHDFFAHYFSAGQLYKRAPVNWMCARVGRVRRVHRSAEGLRLTARVPHTPPITSDLKTIIDHVISRSCGVRIEWYHIKIMSSLHHATHLKTSDFSLSFWSERIYISSGRTEQYWQTQAYFLALVEKYCFTQGPVFTPNCEISIQWNKLWNFEGTNFVLYDGRTRHSKGGTIIGLTLKCI